MNSYESSQTALNRWRLILGSFSDREISFGGSEHDIHNFEDMEKLLDFLYKRAQGGDVRDGQDSKINDRKGSLDQTALTAAEWITKVRTLFPKQTAEVLEKQALEEFEMTELLTDKKILEKMKPDTELLKTIMQLKHLMKGSVLETAKEIARKVSDELRRKIENDVKRSIMGRIDRNTSSPVKSARNLDFKKTIRRNLKNYDREREEIILKDIYFSSHIKKYNKKTVIIAIDESGSMLDSVIYSAVMAQIIGNLPFAEIKIIIFDTSVVDLTGYADEPAEIIMSVQLGGGTNIGKALAYCEQQITSPLQTCVIVVTDLYEGANEKTLINTSRNIIESGAKLSFLTALDRDSEPAFDHILGQKLVNTGAFVGALTPEQLGDYIGRMFS